MPKVTFSCVLAENPRGCHSHTHPGTQVGEVCMLSVLMGMSALWSRWHRFKKRGNLGARQVFNQRAYLFQGGSGGWEGRSTEERGWGRKRGLVLGLPSGRERHFFRILISCWGCSDGYTLFCRLQMVSPFSVGVRPAFADGHKGLAAVMGRYCLHLSVRTVVGK